MLSQLSHPNLVKLIGWCPEEFHSYTSICPTVAFSTNSDVRTTHLQCHGSFDFASLKSCTLSLSIFIPSNLSIVHGDLKPSNILHGENFISKLSDFGICHVLCRDQSSNNDTTLCRITRPKGTSDYIDPDFFLKPECSL